MRYAAAAILMGAVWYVVLLPIGRALPLGGRDWPAKMAVMCAASLTVATVFRRRITSASGTRFHALAICLPAVCSLIFGLYLVAYWWASTLLNPEESLSLGILWVPVYCLVFGAVLACPLTVPMGYLSQWAMQRVARSSGVAPIPHRH
jgi:hypothetical protein